jgi:hypothetical protein
MRPSFIGQAFNGLLMLATLIYAFVYWKVLSNYEQIVVISLLSIQIGLHSVLHHIEEIYYNFNPLEGKWGNSKEPKGSL